MWRIWNKLFGWDYVLVPYGFSMRVAKVMRRNGKIFAVYCGCNAVFELLENGECKSVNGTGQNG